MNLRFIHLVDVCFTFDIIIVRTLSCGLIEIWTFAWGLMRPGTGLAHVCIYFIMREGVVSQRTFVWSMMRPIQVSQPTYGSDFQASWGT